MGYRLTLVSAIATATWAVDAGAAGFAIREQSASFQGSAFAGVAAGGDDISTMFFNPATITLHPGRQAHLSVSFVAPSASFDLTEATTPSGTSAGTVEGGDIAEDAFVPAVYASTNIGDWFVGVGVTAPFGLRTEQPEDWAGRYFATESELTTINVNPVVAYRISKRWSVAAGFVAQYADATLASARFTGGNDAIAEVEGDDWDYGFTLGVLAQPVDGTRIGLGYRSRINHTLEGDFTATDSVTGSVLQTDVGRAALATPQVASLGIRQRVTEEVDLLGSFEWTGWRSFDELRVNLGNNPDIVTPENWRNSWFVALGAEYRPTKAVSLSVGAAFDESPIDDDYRTPRIPGNDRTWVSLGAAWTPQPWVTLGAGYSHLFVTDGDVDLDAAGRGSLRGTFENHVDIVAVRGSFRF